MPAKNTFFNTESKEYKERLLKENNPASSENNEVENPIVDPTAKKLDELTQTFALGNIAIRDEIKNLGNNSNLKEIKLLLENNKNPLQINPNKAIGSNEDIRQIVPDNNIQKEIVKTEKPNKEQDLESFVDSIFSGSNQPAKTQSPEIETPILETTIPVKSKSKTSDDKEEEKEEEEDKKKNTFFKKSLNFIKDNFKQTAINSGGLAGGIYEELEGGIGGVLGNVKSFFTKDEDGEEKQKSKKKATPIKERLTQKEIKREKDNTYNLKSIQGDLDDGKKEQAEQLEEIKESVDLTTKTIEDKNFGGGGDKKGFLEKLGDIGGALSFFKKGGGGFKGLLKNSLGLKGAKGLGGVGEKGSKLLGKAGKGGGLLAKIGSKSGAVLRGGGKALGPLGAVLGAGFLANQGVKKHNAINNQITSGQITSQKGKSLQRENKGETAGKIGGGVSGALGGVAAGAAIGSVVPVVGTLIGGVVGGILGGLGGEYLGGKAGKGIAKITETKKTDKKNEIKNADMNTANRMNKEKIIEARKKEAGFTTKQIIEKNQPVDNKTNLEQALNYELLQKAVEKGVVNGNKKNNRKSDDFTKTTKKGNVKEVLTVKTVSSLTEEQKKLFSNSANSY